MQADGESAGLTRQLAEQIVRRLQEAGFDAFWVGGCVRDFLLGRAPRDYDVATSALPGQVEALFSRTIPVGRQFGIVVVMENGFQFQVATFRAESDYHDGRHPGRVAFGEARADALRRDFTVNGLYYDPVLRQVRDWVGGEADLQAGIIRTIGDPRERFAEDHLRLLRTVRFARQLNFRIEEGTFEAVRALAPKIRGISAERVRDELNKVFEPPRADLGLCLLRDSGLLPEVLPEIAATIGCEQSPGFHPEGDVFNHLVQMLSQLPADAGSSLVWAVLLHDVAKPVTASRDADGTIHFYGHERVGGEMAEGILERLRLPRKEIDDIVKAVRFHMQFKDAEKMRKATLRRLLLRPTFPLELELHRLDCIGSHGQMDIYDYLREQKQDLERQPALVPPLLTGDDLIEMGMQPGPQIGRLLAEVRDQQLQEDLRTTEEARVWAADWIRKNSAGTDGPRC